MNTGQVGIDALGMCTGPETKARLLEAAGAAGGMLGPAGRSGRVSFSGPSPRTTAAGAAGGKPASAGRPGPASFSTGPSPRTKAEGAAGAGTFASGAPGAAALAAAALFLLAPGEARAEGECGIANQAVITCGNAAYNDGIQYFSSNTIGHGNGSTINVPGRSSGPTTITAGASQSTGIKLKVTTQQGATLNVGGATGGVAHIVNIVQGTNSRTTDAYNHGIYFWQNRLASWATVNVKAGVTIGSSSAPMKQRGIFLHWRSQQISQGRGAGSARFTSAATIYAARQGIHFVRENGGTNDETTLTNSGAIFSGVNNPSATGAYFDRPHGIHVLYGGTQMTGTLSVTNSGAITVGGPYTGIVLRNWGVGAMSLDNSGDIGAAAGQTARQGIQFNYEYWDNQSAAAVTLTNSGAITASEYGIRLKKLSGGDVELTNRGAITVTGDAAQHLGHAIYLAEGVTFGDGRTYAANKGDVTVVNEGALRSKNHALYVYRETTTTANAADDFELTNSGAITSEEGDGIRIERPDGTGDMTVDNSGAITAGVNAIWIDEILTPATTGTVSVTHSAGALSAGRSGIVVQVASSATAATVTPRSSSAPQPLIDVAWGSTASSGATARGTTGTAANDNGRFATVGAGNAGARQVLTFDQEAEGSKGSGGVYGGPAGIEAYAISWRDVVAQVALGDDPGAFANAAAQTTAVPTGATVADNAYVAQFRAALENAEIAVAPALLTAIGTTATTAASDLTDAQIVTFLRVDNAGRRTLLRNVLAQGLTDGEKAILRALATNGNVDAALTAAGFTDDTSDDGDYWSLVKALLDRYNVGDIHVNVHSGSIAASRGDGIRAYYATPNDNNGAISVTVGAGASVAGAGTGIYVANAGGDVTVESGGTIRGGTDGIRVIKPGTMGDITITTTGGSITATAGAGIHPQDNAGHTGTVTVVNAGDVTGGTWGILANRLGAGTVSVASSGGTVWGMTEPGIFAANKAGDASDLSVEVTGGAVRSSGRNKAALHAWNRGTGDLSVTGAGAISKHAAGVFADLGSAYSTTSQVDVTQSGPIQGRTGVYVRVAHGATAATPTARAAGQQPLIDVTWTGTFSHGTAPTVAQNDNGRFAAATVAEVLSFDQEAAAVKALDGSLRYGGAAGVDAHALSWRDVVAQVAKGDDPGAIADATAQANLLSTTHADSERTAILAQFRAALGNDEIEVAAEVLTAIDSTATSVSDLSDAEIVGYLDDDDAATRALLRNVLAQGLSDKEKAVLLAVAAGTTTSLTNALDDTDAAFPTAYKNAVNALRNLYNVGNIRVAMNGGSIDSRGDGIRAWYATPNVNNGAITVTVAAGARVTAGKAGVYVANAGDDVTVSHSGTITAGTYGIYVANTADNGAIEVTVAADASVTGATAGVYVANASDGLTLARKYTYGFAMGQGATADQAIAVAYNGASLLDQVVTVAGTVTGGTDAGVRLSGGAVIVMEGGSVRAGSLGVGILADGAALVYVDGEVRGGAGGAAAVHLKGGGDVTVGLNGRVRANGATHAIQRDGTAGTTTLSLITDSSRLTGMVPNRDDLLAQVDGSLSGIDSARLREYANGVPTGYSLTLVIRDGMLDTSKFPSRPTSYECAGGRCDITEAGTLTNRRTGVYAAVKDSMTVASQPVIDVTWTGAARFSQGTVSSDAGRFTAETARDALVFDRESAAVKAVEETIRWGSPAGIEAHALSWRDVAAAVAKGDDPDAIANKAAQDALLATSGAGSRRADILAQFRAALGNADLAVASAVLTAIDSSATSVSDLSDAEIVAYLSEDDAPTRVLLRNILAQGLSEKEEAVLKAVAVGDSAALTIALDDTDANFDNDYKTAVRALLNLYNVGNIRVRMNGGSITAARGDGIRAYYATPHDSNGAIEVSVGAGARVTADRAGVLVANAGGAVTVTNRGTVRAGTYGIYANRLGSGAVSVTNAGTITADTHGIYVADAGGAVTVSNSGTITADTTADTYGIYVADADGDVTVTNSGTVRADTYGIHVVKSGTSGDVTITTTDGSITATATADTGIGIYPQDNAGHTGTVRVSNGGDVTAPTWGIYANRLGAGAVSVTNTGGTVLGMTEPGIFAANKLGDASTVTVSVTGGTVRSEGRNKPAIRARNSGTGDLDLTIAAGATAISKHAAGIFATLDDAAGNRVEITQGGTIQGRTGVYARVAHGTTAETVTPRAAEAQPLIGVTWTGAFSHGTTVTVAPNDDDRFSATTVAEALSFDQEAATVKAQGAPEGSLRYGGAAGIEAQVMSWRDVASVVAKGDDPGEITNAAAQTAMLDTASTDADVKARADAIVAQFRAALGNGEIEVAAAVLTAIDSTATSVSDLSDAEIVTYLSVDADARRTLLRNILAQGLSDDEKSILRAVATNDGVDDALTDAGFTDDPADDDDYWSRVKALLDRYNVGNINVAMTGGSIDSRGDGIRAYYATPHANNGGISVTVAKGASVTGAMAGIYVANAGEGLRIPKRYAPEAIRALAGNADTGEDDLIEVGGLNADGNAIATPYLNQLVTVAGTVTGGTDAAVHLNGGGAVVVLEGGQVLAGSSGVAIKVNDPGPAHLFIDGEVKGKAPVEGEAPARAAVDLPGGGRVIVGRNGRVQADGAANAIRGGDDEETMVALTIATGTTAYRDVVEVQVEGSVEGVEEVRLREYRDGVPTGYDTGTLMVTDGTLDVSGLPLAPCPGDRPRDARGECPTPTTDMDGIRIFFTGGGGMESRADGIRARYETPHEDNGGISVTVAAGASVTGSETGVYVENAGPGLRIPKRYAPEAIRDLEVNEDAGEDDLIAIGRLNAAGDAIGTPYLDQLVTVAGTVTGGTDAAVHLNGGGAVIVLEGGKVHAGSSGVAIKVNDPGPAHLFIAGEVRGGAGGAAAVHLTGGDIIVGRNGRVQANGAAHAIRSDNDAATLTLATGPTADAKAVNAQVEGSLEGVEEVRLRVYRDGVPTGYSPPRAETVTITDDGTLDTSGLPSQDRRDGESEGRLTLKCEEAWDRRCRLYEALPSVLLAMNDQPSYAERMTAARDGNGGWARVEVSRGEWQAKKATTMTPLAYDHRRSAVRAGVDLHAGESARVGVSMHALRGKAEMGVGDVELDGMGGGLSATWLVGGLYVDAQAAVTLYDVEVESYTHGKLQKKDVYGVGYGLEVDVGRRMGVGGMTVTPRAGVEWSKVELDEFVDMEVFGGPRASVSMEEADSVKGRVGVMLEAEMGSGESSGRVFASLDVEQEFSEETEVQVGRELLKTEVRPTAVRLGLGGEFAVAEDMVVRGTAGFRTSGSGTSGYSGGLELQMRF